jgi:hypothetical protein
MGAFEKSVDYLAGRWSYVRKAFSMQKAPRHIRADVPVNSTNVNLASLFENEEEVQKALAIIGWIFADIDLIARNTWAADFSVRSESKQGQMVKVPQHPFMKIYNQPNPWMTKSFLIKYLVAWLYTSDRGAFAYLAPDETGQLAEIWPMNPNRVEIIKGDNYVEGFVYFPKGRNEKPYIIHPQNVLWLRFADQFDYWKSLPPLKAAISAAKIEMGIEESQDKLYNDSRGLPLTVVSLDANLSAADFESARETIRRDWEQDGSTIAVTRAGQISTQSIGFTQSELQIMVAQNMTMNKIDTIFFGWPIRNDEFASGEGLKEMDKMLKEQTYRPLFILLQDHIQSQIIDVFYEGDNVHAYYEDPRTYDRALNIQEAMIFSRWRTMNEMREMNGEPPMPENPDFPGYGDLPVMLAVNSSFIATYYEIGVEEVDEGEDPAEVGNLSDFQDPTALTNQMARDDEPATGNEINVKKYNPAEAAGINEELKRWKTVVKRELRNKGFATSREFVSNVIPESMHEEITKALDFTLTEEQADNLFEEWMVS